MEETKKAVIIAEAENVEAIRDFFTEWWTSAQLYETSAKVSLTIINLVKRHQLTDSEVADFDEFMQQHSLLIDAIKPFERKEESV